jgi:type IV pilus assembly protein PilC
MPKYSFTAKSQKGEPYSGVRGAKDKHDLARAIRKDGYLLISATEVKEGEVSLKPRRQFFPFLGRRVSLKEKMFFVRNLQVMIAAGLPLSRILEILAKQTKNQRFKEVILDIREEIVKGKNFSDSLTKHMDIFPELFQSMIKVGEESGTLKDVLQTLSRQMEKQYKLKSKIKGAMIYPAVIICAMFGIGILMLVVVVPQLAQTFEELEIDLPFTTKVVIGLGDFLAHQWYLAIIMVFVLAFLFRLAIKTKTGKRIIDKLTLRAPIISPIIQKMNIAYTTRTLSSLMAAGVPIIRALEITSGTLGNIYYKSAITMISERVREGEKIAQAMEPYENIYPSIVIQMVAVGEETGETSSILAQLAEFFEEEVSNATNNLATLIEPVIMLIVGVAIGFFAVSIIQPMYSMMGEI